MNDVYRAQVRLLLDVLPLVLPSLPGVQWKLLNIRKLNRDRRIANVEELARVLDDSDPVIEHR